MESIEKVGFANGATERLSEINLNDFLTDAEFSHRGYHPMRDFLSAIADVTIILPLVESIIGYDFITGEDLTDFECGVKGVGALIDLATLGSGSLLTGFAEKGGWKLVAKAVMKEMAVDALASGTAYLTGEALEELGLPPGASLILTAIVSGTVTYVAGEYIFKDAAGNVIEKCTGDELDRILKGEIDNITPEISAVKSSKIGELLEDGVDTLDDALKGGMDAIDGVRKSGTDVIDDVARQGRNYGSPNKIDSLLDERPELTGSTRDKLLSTVQDSELNKIIDQLYRPGATVGDGGTAAKLVEEFNNGKSTHLIKATERLKQLKDLQNSGVLGLNDLDVAEALIDDLEYAIDLFD